MSVEDEKGQRRRAARERKHALARLLQPMLQTTGLSAQVAAERLGLSYDQLYGRYLKPDHHLHTDPDDTLALAHLLAPGLAGRGAEGLRALLGMLDLLQLPLGRFAELRERFPQPLWAEAWRAVTGEASAVRAGATAPARPGLFQLRAAARDFVGRGRELERIVGWMRQTEGGAAPIVVASGLAGIGKTELALKAAQRLAVAYPDGQLWVSLYGSSEAPMGAEAALADLIGAFEPGFAPPDEGAGRLERLRARYCAHLAGRRILVVVDDAGAPWQAEPLMPPAGCGLLVTGRPRLALPGALHVNLGALAPEEAARLYEAICPRAGLLGAKLAALCGNLPLAVRVSASALRSDATVSPARYLERLAGESERLAVLRGPGDGRDLEAALALSVAGLSPAERAAIAQLAVFRGGFDLAAAAAVLEPGEGAEGLLSALYLRSLIEYDETSERSMLQDLVRVYAATLQSEDRTLRRRHALHYLGVARGAERRYLAGGAGARDGLARFDQDRRQIETAWAFARQGDEELALALTLATVHVGELRLDHATERIPRLEAALEAAGRLRDRRGHTRLQGALGRSRLACGDAALAAACFRAQGRCAEEDGDEAQAAAAALGLGLAAFALSDFAEARAQFGAAAARARACGERRSEAEALSGLAQVQHIAGELERALASFDVLMELALELHDLRGQSLALGGKGNVLYDLGREDEAGTCYALQLGIARELGDRREEADALGGLGYLSLAARRHEEARAHFRGQLLIARELGSRREAADALAGLGHVALRLGAASDALVAYEEQLALDRQTGNLREEGYALGGIGDVYAAMGDLATARGHYERWLDLARRIGHRKGAALAAWRLGRMLVQLGQAADGLALMEERAAFAHAVGHPGAPALAAELRRMKDEG